MEDQILGRRRFLTGAGATGAGLAAALLTNLPAAAAEGEATEHLEGLAGTWLVTVSLNHSNPPPDPAPFLALFTFNPGGGVLETDQTVASDPIEGPVHGNWVPLGGRRFRYYCLGMNFNKADGSPFGFSKFGETLELSRDGRHYTGSGWDALVNLNGDKVFTANFTTSAERLAILTGI